MTTVREFALPFTPLRSLLLMALLAFALPARAEDACLIAPSIPDHLMSEERVEDYASVLRSCHGEGGSGVAIRAMKLDGEPALLLADPETLRTRVERAACWTCHDIDDADLAGTRLTRAIARSAEAPGITHRGFLQDAGLKHGAAPGAFITGDLCPSSHPLDRRFFDDLAAKEKGAPISLSISGLWLLRHFADYTWLLRRQEAGDFEITWVNHTYRHPYKRGVPDDRNFELTPGVDPDAEILRVERLLIANGQTPSVFFRFPGLISSAPLMEAARRHHLITLGADAWLALNQRPGPGSIILVHPNGNEEIGLTMFERDLAKGAISQPLEPLIGAP